MQTPRVDKKITPNFLDGGGEMGELIRNHAWSKTTIGGIELWPKSLRTSIGIILHSKFPMLLFWGTDLLCFYNDAFRPSLGAEGKHPASLGKPGRIVWEEIWDVIKPWMDEVMQTGEGISKENLLVPFYRNGRIEDIYWTFSYSPAYGDDGNVNGVVVTCVETTNEIIERNSNRELIKQLSDSEARFRNLIRNAPVAIAVFRGEDLITEIANDAYLPLVGKTREEFEGKPLFESLPETKERLKDVVEQVVGKGIPYHGSDFKLQINRNGRTDTCYFNYIWEPYINLNGDIDGFIGVVMEVTEQVEARKLAEMSERNLRAVVESAPFPIGVYTGKEMRIQLANQTMLDTWGKGNDVIGKLYSEILPELVDQSIFEQLDGVYTTGVPFHANNQRVDLVIDGELKVFYFKYSFTPLFDIEGNVYGVMNTAANVTDLVTAQAEIRALNAKKDEFMSIASHELKTPVTSIKLYNQLLDRHTIDDSSKLFIQKSAQQLSKLERLIGDLLDVSKINTGHLQYRFEPVNLEHIIYETIDSLRQEGSKHELELHSIGSAIIQGDKIRIEQVIYNLASNAIKYSPGGKKVQIALTIQNNNAVVSVKDEGIGISSEEAEKIFDRFYRVNDATKIFSGLGLGLFIATQIVEAHNGKLWVKSELGKGSTFYFSIPLVGS
jgi:PAS domain S-box-containing protein